MYNPDNNYIEITVRVPYPNHQHILNYLEQAGWEKEGRYLSKDGDKFIWSKWSKQGKGIVRVLESTDSVSYRIRQREALELIAVYDNWRDPYQAWQYITGLDATAPVTRLRSTP